MTQKWINDIVLIVVLCIGEYQDYSGKGNSRADICIHEIQIRLARSVIKANKNTAVLLFTDRPLAIVELDSLVPAIINMWQPGTEDGNAAADLLFGDANTSVKLSMSFLYAIGQCPIYYNHFNTGRQLKTDYNTATYSSRYQDCPNGPLYPFGYGLSYSEFIYSDLTISSETLDNQGSISISVNVRNIGQYRGDEVVQLYIRDLFASVVRPVKELKALKKITLEPGESCIVTFEITEPMLKFWNRNMEFVSEKGEFEAMIGPNSKNVESKKFKLI